MRYRCGKCGHEFNARKPEVRGRECPRCHSTRLHRLPSPSPVRVEDPKKELMGFLEGEGDPVEAVTKLGYAPEFVRECQRDLMELMAMRSEDQKGALSRLLLTVGSHGSYRLEHCTHVSDGLCSHWIWDERPPAWLDATPERRSGGYQIHPDPIYCAVCSGFISRE